MKINLLENVSKLTTISERKLLNLLEKANLCLGHELFTGSQVGEQIFEIDVGVGELQVINNNTEIIYNFVPSGTFEKVILDAIDGKDILANYLEDSLSKKLLDTYKDV